MLITNLAAKSNYINLIDCGLIEKCLEREHLSQSLIHKYAYENVVHSRNKGVIPFYFIKWPLVRSQILRHIPIFLVTKNERLKRISVGYFGYKDDVLVPWDVMPYQITDDVDFLSFEEDSHSKEIDPYKGELNRDNAVYSCLDLWGLYTREHPQGRDYGVEESHPRIFIWIDKIFDYVGQNKHKCRILSAQVILHELSHAMMDVCLTGAWNLKHHNITLNPIFYTLKEESLANAISLLMLNSNINSADRDFIVSVVKQQPFEYTLGLEYLNCFSSGIERCVRYWMRLKYDLNYSKSVIHEWIRYIKSTRPLDRRQLHLLDFCMCSPYNIYRYPVVTGGFYNHEDLCIQIIKDYFQSNLDCSRSNLHDAFPDTINDDYEALIDYPEQQEFHNKDKDSFSQTIFVNEDNIITCSDGAIAICDYWNLCSVEKFINNAKRLGIDIETFSK